MKSRNHSLSLLNYVFPGRSLIERRLFGFIHIIFVGCVLVSFTFVLACRRAPADDTEAGRIEEAKKLLKTMDLRSLVDGLTEGRSEAKPGIDKEAFRDFISREIRWPELEKMILDTLAKHFTTLEIRDLAEFQNRSEGKSLIEKLPAYQADIGPTLQAEIQRAIAAEEYSRTKLHWDSPHLELTLGPADEVITAEFSFRNEGSQPIRLLTITTSCGCTTVKPEKTEYQPGERGIIRAIFSRSNLTGVREEKVYITTDELAKPSISLQLRVTISEPVKITPPLVIWESGDATATKTVSFEIPPGVEMDVVRNRIRPWCFFGEIGPR